jgi:hypothetical protein
MVTVNYSSSNSLKGVAFEYWKLGHRIVPLKGKTPIVEWRRWQTEAQTLQDFEQLPWEKADGFAIICGIKLNNGYYIGALDVDVDKGGEPLSEDVLENQDRVLKHMRITQLEETPSGGKHLLYYSMTPIETKSDDRCGIEVLGAGKLCIMAPSKGYRRLNDNTPSTVTNLNLEFQNALDKAGLKPPALKASILVAKKKRRRKGKVRYCCEVALKRDNNICHLMRLTIASEYKRLGWTDHDIVDLFRKQKDFDPNKCLTQVRSADPNRTATCESIRQWGYCYPECPQYQWTLDEAIDYELKMTESIRLHPFMDYHPEIGFTIGAFLKASGKILQIMDQNVIMVDSGTLLVEELNPHNVSVKEPGTTGMSANQLAEILFVSKELRNAPKNGNQGEKDFSNKLLDKTQYYFYHSDQRWHLAICCYIIMTYHHRLFPILPHMVFQGPRESGKSTIGLFMKTLCWNPTNLQSGLRSAPLFRSIEASRPTFFADLTKVNAKDADLIDLFEVIEQDGSVRRCVGEENEPADFYVFCPKVLLVRQSVPFSHKCIECITERAPKGSPYTIRRRFIKVDHEIRDIRINLLRSAISNWRKVNEAYESIEQDEKLFGRRFDLWRPLLAICKVYYPERYNDLLSLAHEDAEKAEKGDITSDVEETLLAYFLQFEAAHETFLLKDLTAHAQNQLGPQIVKSYHIVASALKNLGIVKKKLQTPHGVKYQINITKAHTLTKDRNINPSTNINITNLDIDAILSIHELKPITRGDCPLCRKKDTNIVWQVQLFDGSHFNVCMDCGGRLIEELQKRHEASQ